jgi:hypothetical protein
LPHDQQTEDHDDHEHDHEKSRRFFIVLVPSSSIAFLAGQTEDDDAFRM